MRLALFARAFEPVKETPERTPRSGEGNDAEFCAALGFLPSCSTFKYATLQFCSLVHIIVVASELSLSLFAGECLKQPVAAKRGKWLESPH